MKVVRVSIQDEHTLVLQEAASKGDLIDLTSLHETDIDQSTIKSVVSSIKKDAFEAELQKARESIEREKSLELQLKEQELLQKVQALETEKESAAKLAQANAINESQTEIAMRDTEIAELRLQLRAMTTEKQLAVTEAVTRIEKERDHLQSELRAKESEKLLLESSMKQRYETQIKDREDTIERLKDMKARLSIKLVGENLEQHCHNEFNSVRSSLFPYAYFEKDNTAVEGTKGDFVYRDYDLPGGTEVISIMFEMKDEQDASENRRTIESHLKKLDADRAKKQCEYAVLVTLLEAENELYNRGIVDVSFKYDKMFVIRPQFFLPLISLLKNANMKTLEAKRQLVALQTQNIDVTNFESDLNDYKVSVSRNTDLAFKQLEGAIGEIDKSIERLTKAKEGLLKTGNNLRLANNKVQDISIKRLTRGNPTMQAKFEEIE